MHLLACLLACALASGVTASAAASDPPRGEVVPRLSTLAEPDLHYSLFLPVEYVPSRRWPVLILLDARGRGEHVLRLADPAARRNGWMLLSSHDSRSDVDEAATVRAMRAMLRETGQRYAYDPGRIYLAGFSGTAKTLWTQVRRLEHVIAGLFGNGGGRPPELGRLRQAPPAFFGTTGSTDFNFREMHDLDAALAAIGATRRLEVFEGGHAWPNADAFGDALDWFDLVAMRDGRLARDEDWIDAQLASRIRIARGQRDVLARSRALDQAVRDFSGMRDVASLATEARELAGSPGFLARQSQDARLHDAERAHGRRLDAWIARIQARDAATGRRPDPPTTPMARRDLGIRSLEVASRDPDPAVAASAGRRLERVAVAVGFYLPQRYAAEGDHARAAAMLAIAVAIHPARAGTHWRLAGEYAQLGRIDQAFAALAEARGLGFVDVRSLERDACWDGLRDDPRWGSASAPLR